MTGHWENQDHQFYAVRPLVRYVDETQAVVDTHITIARNPGQDYRATNDPYAIRVCMTGSNGDRYDHQAELSAPDAGAIRFEIDDPQRWWPAGMGDQTLYDLTVELLIDDEAMDTWQTSIGLTSVRPGRSTSDTTRRARNAIAEIPDQHSTHPPRSLLVNGRERSIHSVIHVSPSDENQVLPICGDSLVIVKGHYGSDRLYDAADRAGILIIQTIVADDNLKLGAAVVDEINRLVAHPSLAGWSVNLSEDPDQSVAHQIHRLDPTRSIFRSVSDLN